MVNPQKLDTAVRAVCPIVGVSIGRDDDRGTWAVQFLPEATAEQRNAAHAVIDTFDAAEPRLVPKSLIVSRLIDAGKIAAANTALESDPAAKARWYAADRPAIRADDPDAIALLQAIGANPEEILAS